MESIIIYHFVSIQNSFSLHLLAFLCYIITLPYRPMFVAQLKYVIHSKHF